MSPREDRERGRETTPQRMAETNPPAVPTSDYSFTLQAVFEMQKTVGQLMQGVETLTHESRENSKKLNHISHVVYAVGAVVTVIGGIAGFVLRGVWEVVAPLLQSHLH
jgi:hypothetical protein